MENPNQQPSADFKQWLVKSVGTGAVAAAASYFLLGEQRNISIMGRDMPSVIPIGLGAAAGSLTADMAHQWIFPLIHASEKYDKAEAAALGVASAGLGTYVATSVLGGGSPAILPALLVGGGSYVAADYAYHYWFNKASGGFIW